MISLQKHYSQWWKSESIHPKIRNKTRVSTFTTTIQHSFGSPSYSNKRWKRNKKNPDRKICEALTVCRWHDIVHRKPQAIYLWFHFNFKILDQFHVCRIFDGIHSDWHKVVPHCFDLHFSDNEWCWASFHMFVSHWHRLSLRSWDGTQGVQCFFLPHVLSAWNDSPFPPSFA